MEIVFSEIRIDYPVAQLDGVTQTQQKAGAR